jgi:hypothetical protein
LTKVLHARPIQVGDGANISAMMQRVTPLHNNLIDRLPAVIDKLAEEEAIIGTVVEARNGRGPAKIVGVTVLGFVSDDTANDYINSPFPALSSALLNNVGTEGTAPFLGRKEQAEGNLGAGMEKVIIEFAIDPMDLRHPDFGGVMHELYSANFQFERGFNTKAVMVEAAAELEPLITGTGLRPVKHFDMAGHNEDIRIPPGIGTKRCFYRITRADMATLPPSCAAAVLMTYMKPTFRFTPTEQRLIKKSIEGKTDEQIAEALSISRDAVKQTWRTIYDHVMSVMPDILEDDSEDLPVGRGTEKRRRIVAYVRNNLQELKPHYARRG